MNTNLFLDCVKLIGYLAAGVTVVSSNPCVFHSLRINTSLLLLPICTDELQK